jgi:hypothetical protein
MMLMLGMLAFAFLTGGIVWGIRSRLIPFGPDDLGYVIIAFIATWLFGGFILASRYLLHRQLRRLLNGKMPTPRSVHPPSAASLAPGERIEVERQGYREPLWVRQGANALILVIWGITLIEAKSFIQSAFGVFLFAFSIAPLLLTSKKEAQLLRIVADDEGVTLKQGRRKPRHMAWQEMTRMVRDATLEDATRSTYLVLGHDRVLNFSPFEGQDEKKYVFSESYDAYRSGIARILATLVARTGMPIMTYAYIGPSHDIDFAMTVEDAQALPSVPAEMQPQSADIPTIKATEDRLVFGPRLERWQFAAKALLPMFVAVLLFQGFLLIHFTDWFSHPVRLDAFTQFLWVLSFVLSLSLPWIAFFQMEAAAFRRRYPYVIATDYGIVRMSVPRWPLGEVTIMPWEKIQAWVMLPPHKGRTEYVLFSAETVLRWCERDGLTLDESAAPDNDLHAAYHRRAAQLHALIVQRTGQPLRIFSASGT